MSQPLAEGIFWIAALACVVAEAAILRSTYLARGAQRSALVPAASRGREITWAIIPALALAALLVVTWQKIHARDAHMMMMDHSGMPSSMAMPSTSQR
jgi:heme/copper-type cytochrome/quinol oxidase subunit 2